MLEDLAGGIVVNHQKPAVPYPIPGTGQLQLARVERPVAASPNDDDIAEGL
jgi:hypothetical protein